jgi:hypothetical protein
MKEKGMAEKAADPESFAPVKAPIFKNFRSIFSGSGQVQG